MSAVAREPGLKDEFHPVCAGESELKRAHVEAEFEVHFHAVQISFLIR